jgi:TorA maturation chaperone TorD
VTASHFAFAGRAFLDTDARRLLDALDDIGNSSAEVEALRSALAASGQDLEIEYVRLFLNPAGAPCPPWQSANHEEAHLMGSAHKSASLWYSKYGAAPKASSDPADHIGLLLMFYAQLASAEAEEEECRRFAAQHLAWIPGFCDKIARESKHDFYVRLAGLTAQLTRSAL